MLADLRGRTPHPLVGPPSLHAATLTGGSGLSTYAAGCRLQIERRTIPGESRESVYLLAGIAFGGIFATLEATAPGSFASATPVEIDDAVYFSFVTLATLGYGDIVLVARAARALAVLEAVFGQLYLAVLFARLGSLYAREPRDPAR